MKIAVRVKPGAKRSAIDVASDGAASRHIEREVRLLAADRCVHNAVASLRGVGRFRVVSRCRERQRNTYFDTADLRLRRTGSVLKLRHIGRRRQLIFKRALGYVSNVGRHLEVAVSISRTPVRMERAALAPVAQVRALIGPRPLQPLFTLHTDRRRRILADGRQRIELAIDELTCRAGRIVLAQRLEVEVENLTASSARFARALAELRRQFGASLRPSRVSKFEYGLKMFRRAASSAVL